MNERADYLSPSDTRAKVLHAVDEQLREDLLPRESIMQWVDQFKCSWRAPCPNVFEECLASNVIHRAQRPMRKLPN